MSKKKPKNTDCTGQPGSSENAGASFCPEELPEEESPHVTPEAGAIPLGLPISAEEYKELQRKARHLKMPPNDGAQEGPAAASDSSSLARYSRRAWATRNGSTGRAETAGETMPESLSIQPMRVKFGSTACSPTSATNGGPGPGRPGSETAVARPADPPRPTL